jgi:hypothetical protein
MQPESKVLRINVSGLTYRNITKSKIYHSNKTVPIGPDGVLVDGKKVRGEDVRGSRQKYLKALPGASTTAQKLGNMVMAPDLSSEVLACFWSAAYTYVGYNWMH